MYQQSASSSSFTNCAALIWPQHPIDPMMQLQHHATASCMDIMYAWIFYLESESLKCGDLASGKACSFTCDSAVGVRLQCLKLRRGSLFVCM